MPAMPDLNSLSLPELWAHIAQTGLPRRLLELARDEDLVGGLDGGLDEGQPGEVRHSDRTAQVTSASAEPLATTVVVREAGVVAGLAAGHLVAEVFAETLDQPVELCALVADGSAVAAGTSVATLSGAASAVVTIERTLLNVIGRLSGVATRTAQFVHAVESTQAQILDTRKTTPGLRVLEKYAVRCGGGHCHRLGLHDAVLIKDNHVAGLDLDDFEQRVRKACTQAAELRQQGQLRFVQVEVDTLEQFERTLRLEAGLIDFVLLDNFSLESLAAAVAQRDAQGSWIKLEASGGVNLETVGGIARTGVDRISVGGLTHHAVSLDVGLDATR